MNHKCYHLYIIFFVLVGKQVPHHFFCPSHLKSYYCKSIIYILCKMMHNSLILQSVLNRSNRRYHKDLHQAKTHLGNVQSSAYQPKGLFLKRKRYSYSRFLFSSFPQYAPTCCQFSKQLSLTIFRSNVLIHLGWQRSSQLFCQLCL